MPYYVHEKDENPETGVSFRERKDAHTACNTATHKITFLPTYSETDRWQSRERNRFYSGEYMAVPWANLLYSTETQYHFTHLSLKRPGLIAYTRDDEAGHNDRQTPIKPGRYLEMFFKDRDLDTDQVQKWIAQCAKENLELRIATTPEDIVRVYMNGPTSCMDGRHDFDDGHPCRVYGNSDLAVAYYGDIDAASGRSVVWPEKKIYVRVYGGEHMMVELLEKAGYKRGDLNGARIRAIASGNGYVMPYVDGIDFAEDNGDGFLILGQGDIDAQPTGGVSEEPDRTRSCDHCDRDYDYDEDNDSGYCSRCEDNRASCDNCSDRIWLDDDEGYTRLTNGDILCESCSDNARAQCEIENCDEEWIERAEFQPSERRDRSSRGVSGICRSCAIEYERCLVCNEDYVAKNGSESCATCEKNGDAPVEKVVTPPAESSDESSEPGYRAGAACNCYFCRGERVKESEAILALIMESPTPREASADAI
jgi:hypothetical protein